jgi:hypothetical protein
MHYLWWGEFRGQGAPRRLSSVADWCGKDHHSAGVDRDIVSDMSYWTVTLILAV